MVFSKVLYGVAVCGLCACAYSIPTPQTPPVAHPPPPVAKATPLQIVHNPIPFGAERKRLTQAYLRKHWGAEHLSGDLDADITMVPRMVVLHWTAGKSAQGAWNTFAPTTLPGRPDLQKAGMLNVSAQFVVDRDGTVWRLMDDDRVARHVIGLNHVAIGVENAGGAEGFPMTEAQVTANIALVRELKGRWPTITHLIGHYEYQDMEGHAYFQETDPTYRTVKVDPGPGFMGSVRAGVADLGLEGVPSDK